MVDFHSHILPSMDDGSKSIDESISMLAESYKQGVELMMATPHFYPWKESPKEFLLRRASSAKQLVDNFDFSIKTPKIILGAEVAYFEGIANSDEIRLLKIGKSNYILIEMPMITWNKRILDTLHAFENRYNLKIVLAHIERYIDLQKGTKNIEYVFENFLIQINANYFINSKTQKKALKLVKHAKMMMDFLGSDCHNMTTRPQNLYKATLIIENLLGKKYVDNFYNHQKKLIERGFNYEK